MLPGGNVGTEKLSLSTVTWERSLANSHSIFSTSLRLTLTSSSKAFSAAFPTMSAVCILHRSGANSMSLDMRDTWRRDLELSAEAIQLCAQREQSFICPVRLYSTAEEGWVGIRVIKLNRFNIFKARQKCIIHKIKGWVSQSRSRKTRTNLSDWTQKWKTPKSTRRVKVKHMERNVREKLWGHC